jgi:hypothetical protein
VKPAAKVANVDTFSYVLETFSCVFDFDTVGCHDIENSAGNKKQKIVQQPLACLPLSCC